MKYEGCRAIRRHRVRHPISFDDYQGMEPEDRVEAYAAREVLEEDLAKSKAITDDIKALIAEVKQLYKAKKWKVKMSQEYVKKEEDFMDALDNEETVIEQHTGKSTRLQTKQAKGKVKVRKRKGKA